MTTEQVEDYGAVLEEIVQVTADSVNFRANVAPGTPLGYQEIEPGANVIWRKPQSGQRANNRPLPERVALYNKVTGDVSMVPPTIATKRALEQPETFTLRKPEGLAEKQPIAETCPVCLISRKGVPRAFYSEFDLENHMQVLHPREYALIQRKQENEERREERQALRDLAEAVLAERGEARRGRKASE